MTVKTMTRFKNMKMVNLPLLVLFALAYGLGHPAVAAFRPQVVDKTLASFHVDVNRTAQDLTVSLVRLVDHRTDNAAQMVSPTIVPPSPEPRVTETRTVQVASAPAALRMTDLPRKTGTGFTALKAR